MQTPSNVRDPLSNQSWYFGNIDRETSAQKLNRFLRTVSYHQSYLIPFIFNILLSLLSSFFRLIYIFNYYKCCTRALLHILSSRRLVYKSYAQLFGHRTRYSHCHQILCGSDA